MGPTHSAVGVAAGVATLPAAPVHNLAGQVAWVAVCGGMALIPDWDHLHTSITRMWGGFTLAPARVIAKVSGGHRWGTHDLILGPAAFGLLATADAAWLPTRMLLVALAIGLALHACNVVIPGRTENTVVGNLALSWGGAWALCTYAGPTAAAWLPQAVIVGVFAHLFADAPTEQGLPIPIAWWFIRRRRLTKTAKRKHAWWEDGRMELPSMLAFKTGDWFEKWVVLPAVVASIVALAFTQTQLGTAARAAVDATRHVLATQPH